MATVANAQRIVQAESQKDVLKLRYELPLQKPASQYALIATPLLCGPNDTLPLEPIMVRGAQSARKLHRAYVLQHLGAEPAYIQASRMPASVIREAEVSLTGHPWVKNAPLTLALRYEQEGCCEVKTWLANASEDFRYEQPYAPIYNKVQPFTGLAGVLQKENPVLERIDNYRPYDNTRVLRKESGMIYVHFPPEGTEIDTAFRNNAERLASIVGITRQIMGDTTSVVKKIQIIGLSSVEGRDALNNQLAGERAEALKRYVQQEVNVPDELFEVVNGGAAWTEFRDQVNDADFAGKDQVLKIMDNTQNPDRRQWLSRQLQGGKPYEYMREHLLPDERNAGYIRIYWDAVPDEDAKVINEAAALLQQEQWTQALQLLNRVKTDERAQNALAVALYMTGDEASALQIWRRRAAMGDADAQRNLEQLEK